MARRLHIHLDLVGGVAGDMFVAAMIDALPELEARVMKDVAAVLPPEAGRPELSVGESSGMHARRFRLVGGAPRQAHGHAHHHHHPHDHHDHAHDHAHDHGQAHRETQAVAEVGTFIAFCRRIEAAGLSDGAAARAIDILRRIAQAEAEIHHVPIEEVHFHELADWDALMDVVAAGSIAAALGEASWSLSTLPLGGGLVKTQHGKLPVPAPATAHILRGYQWRDDGVMGERVTPTGAAIVAHLTNGEGNRVHAGGRLKAVGSGAGTRALPGMPNVVRATVFETGAVGVEQLTILAFEIDDMTGEEIATAADRLRRTQGVRDVMLLAAQGKKGRPLTRMEVQVEPASADAVADAVFVETSTLGLRRMDVRRDLLERRAEISPDGIRRKRAFRPGGGETFKIEQDDLAGLASLAARRERGRSDT